MYITEGLRPVPDLNSKHHSVIQGHLISNHQNNYTKDVYRHNALTRRQKPSVVPCECSVQHSVHFPRNQLNHFKLNYFFHNEETSWHQVKANITVFCVAYDRSVKGCGGVGVWGWGVGVCVRGCHTFGSLCSQVFVNDITVYMFL